VKGIVRIGGAVAIGIVIISGAFYVKNTDGTEASGRVVVAQAPERTYIETTDSNNNGIKDWEENLRRKMFETITTPPSTISVDAEEAYEPPTTFTGKFSEAFLQDYLQGKINGADFSDPTALVGNALTAIQQNTQSKKYSRLHVQNIIPDSLEASRAYGNRLGEIMRTRSINNEHEVTILERALDKNDPQELEALLPIQEVYARTVEDMLRMDVPVSLMNTHVELLNAHEAIRTDIGAMRQVFADPLLALARIQQYETDARALFNAFNWLLKNLTATGVFYTSNDPGFVFYLFEL